MELERLEYMEEREFDRMSRFNSYPFNHGGDEGLVNDSISYRNFRRRELIKKNQHRF
mgnify:CR=1 FL=1